MEVAYTEKKKLSFYFLLASMTNFYFYHCQLYQKNILEPPQLKWFLIYETNTNQQ